MAVTFDPISAVLGVGGIASNIFTNQAQKDIFNKQLEFQKYQYEDMKRYNSARSQVDRLRAAGMNPAFAFGQNAGVATGVSEPAAPSLNPLDLNGLSSIASGIRLNSAQADNMLQDTQLKQAQTEKTVQDINEKVISNRWADLLYQDKHHLNNLDAGLRRANTYSQRQLGRLTRLQGDYQELSMNDQLSALRSQTSLNQSMEALNTLNALAFKTKLHYEITETQARIANMYMTGRASLQQAAAAATNAAANDASVKAQFGKNPEERAKYFRTMIHQMEDLSKKFHNEAAVLYKDYDNYDVDKWFRRGSQVVNAISTGATAASPYVKGYKALQEVKAFNNRPKIGFHK